MKQKSRSGEYREMRENHEREMKELLQRTVDECGSINSASKKLEINVGSLWRMCQRLNVEVRDDQSS